MFLPASLGMTLASACARKEQRNKSSLSFLALLFLYRSSHFQRGDPGGKRNGGIRRAGCRRARLGLEMLPPQHHRTGDVDRGISADDYADEERPREALEDLAAEEQQGEDGEKCEPVSDHRPRHRFVEDRKSVV